MGSKLNPGKFDCYTNALPDEPMFVLLARDPYAPETVRIWAKARELANRAGKHPTDPAKIAEAMDCAETMRRWRDANPKPEGGYPRATEPESWPVAYMRTVDEGTPNECHVMAAKGDPGAFPVYR